MKKILPVFLCLVLSACSAPAPAPSNPESPQTSPESVQSQNVAAASRLEYSPPQTLPGPAREAIVVDISSRYVEQAVVAFFGEIFPGQPAPVFENRKLSASLDVSPIEGVVDCGQFALTASGKAGPQYFSGNAPTMEFLLADASGQPVTAKRSASTLAEVTISVIPLSGAQTEIAVSSKYVLNVELQHGQSVERDNIVFSTGETGRGSADFSAGGQISGGPLACVSTNMFEKTFLAGILAQL